MLPHVFVINLKRSADRRADMAKRLDPLVVPYSFFEGVDGKNLDLAALPDYDRKRRLRYFGRDLRLGEIGCLLSHRGIYQHMSDNSIPVAVVLEDDTFLAPELPDVLRALMAIQPQTGWEVVRFLEGNKVQKKSRLIAPLTGKYNFMRPLIASGGAYGYVLTLKAARTFLEHMKTNYVPVDTVHSYIWKTGLEVFNVLPSPVTPDRVIDSTIGEQRFDKTLDISGLQKITYVFTRLWLKLSELAGKRWAYGLAELKDMALKRKMKSGHISVR